MTVQLGLIAVVFSIRVVEQHTINKEFQIRPIIAVPQCWLSYYHGYGTFGLELHLATYSVVCHDCR